MLSDIKDNTELRMQKSIESLHQAFSKIRTGRAHASLLDSVLVSYYGSQVPISQVANVSNEDARTLAVRVWEKNITQDVEKAILKSDLGLNPSTAGDVIRIPLPPLTEETRKGYTRQARQEAEQARVAIRNIRRDVVADIKQQEKDKEISEDDNRRAQDDIQKITDKYILQVDEALADKEKDLMAI